MPRRCPDCEEEYWEKCPCGFDQEMEEGNE